MAIRDHGNIAKIIFSEILGAAMNPFNFKNMLPLMLDPATRFKQELLAAEAARLIMVQIHQNVKEYRVKPCMFT